MHDMSDLSPRADLLGADRSDRVRRAAPSTSPARPADVEIVIPVHNERRALERSVRTLHRPARDHAPARRDTRAADDAGPEAQARAR
jgi:hypothetical protein